MSQLVQSGGRFSPACTHCAVYSIIFGVLHSNEPEWNAAMIEPTSDINDQLKFKWQHASNVEHGNIVDASSLCGKPNSFWNVNN